MFGHLKDQVLYILWTQFEKRVSLVFFLIKKKGCARVVAPNLFLHFDKILYGKKHYSPLSPPQLYHLFFFLFFGGEGLCRKS
jgi:hypothetical protein